MDLNTHFLVNHSEHFINSRIDAARTFGYGNGSFAATMIAGMASAVRRVAATIEGWARGRGVEVIEHRLPRPTSAR